ncbi:hypothetical protein D3C71_1326030 [compost metagenome]
MDHWMIIQSRNTTVRPVGLAPVGVLHELPPQRPIVQVDPSGRLAKDQRPCIQHLGQGAGIVAWVRRHFGKRAMASCRNKLGKLCVADWGFIDEKALDTYTMSRLFFWIVMIRAHPECPTVHVHHLSEHTLR